MRWLRGIRSWRSRLWLPINNPEHERRNGVFIYDLRRQMYYYSVCTEYYLIQTDLANSKNRAS